MAWRKEVDLSEWIRQYSIRRYGVDDPELKQLWDILLPYVYHNKVHLGVQPPMVLEPSHTRRMNPTNYTDIVNAYHLIHKVCIHSLLSQSKIISNLFI